MFYFQLENLVDNSKIQAVSVYVNPCKSKHYRLIICGAYRCCHG